MSDKKILTVFGETKSEKTIERSKFITYSKHVESEEEARSFIAGVKSEHSLATHVCFAFIADKLGNLCRFSDDGEPQGTAGVANVGRQGMLGTDFRDKRARLFLTFYVRGIGQETRFFNDFLTLVPAVRCANCLFHACFQLRFTILTQF